MPRIRTIKPELFTHTKLFDIEQQVNLPIRLSFCGLFTCCDREGRFKWDPRELKIHILPYDDIDFSRVLDALWTRGFIVKYVSGTDEYGVIPTWSSHQFINNRESGSKIPNPTDCIVLEPSETLYNFDALLTRDERVLDATRGERKGREGKGKERIISDTNVSSSSEKKDEKQDKISFDKILDAYHQKLESLPKVKVLSDKRKKSINALCRQHPKAYDESWWDNYFEHVSQSDFLMGNKSGWKADFEFLINYNNMLKVIEGKYHAKQN